MRDDFVGNCHCSCWIQYPSLMKCFKYNITLWSRRSSPTLPTMSITLRPYLHTLNQKQLISLAPSTTRWHIQSMGWWDYRPHLHKIRLLAPYSVPKGALPLNKLTLQASENPTYFSSLGFLHIIRYLHWKTAWKESEIFCNRRVDRRTTWKARYSEPVDTVKGSQGT